MENPLKILAILLSLVLVSCDSNSDNDNSDTDNDTGSTGSTTDTGVASDNENAGMEDDSDGTGTDLPDNLASSVLSSNVANPWYQSAREQVLDSQSYISPTGSAKNIILFIGDGMGISTVTAARILDGQQKGMLGEENSLSFDEMPFAGLAKTYNVDAQTPDSAGTMTAIISGVKTDAGVIGVDETVERGDCTTVTGSELVTALELAELQGKATGIISTARITHATPAATYAKSVERGWEDNADMPDDALAAGCTDIAAQLISFQADLQARFSDAEVDGLEVAMGGGRRHFLPMDAAFNSADANGEVEGDRTDGRHLIDEWTALYADGVYVFDQAGFDAVDAESTTRLLGLFNESHMQYESDRSNDIAGEPSLTEMTEKAIQIMDKDEDGFFLMVESGRIDHAHHAGNAFNALEDTIELSKAVQAARDLTSVEDTLIIVTADHGHVFTIAGYPKRGNPILGKVTGIGQTTPALASDDLPYTTLGYTNGRGFSNRGDQATNADGSYVVDIAAGRQDVSLVDTASPGFDQETLVPLTAETHSGEDVGIYAQGPGAALLSGTSEQNMIFHVMNHAAGLSSVESGSDQP